MLRIIQPALIQQLNDQRTSVVREACGLIRWMSSKFRDEFSRSISSKGKCLGGGDGAKYLQVDALPKLIICGTKLHQDIAHQTIREMFENCPRLQEALYYLMPFVNSKNALMRLRVAQYLEMMLQGACNSSMSKSPFTPSRSSSYSSSRAKQFIE